VSLSARLLDLYLRRWIKPRLLATRDLDRAARLLYPGSLGWTLRPPRRATFGGVEGELTPAHGAAAARLFYLHGGAYFAGSARHYRRIARFFAQWGFEVFVPDYRLAPHHPFPAALDDAQAAFDAFAAQNDRPLHLAGDSAGGGLALALLCGLRDAGAALPAAAALFSPWTDLAATGESIDENEARDALLSRKMLKSAARNYLGRDFGRANARDPRASPLYADLSGLPPLLIHVGATEVLRSDATRLAERASAAGVDAHCEIFAAVPHGWQLSTGATPEARESLEKAVAFFGPQTQAARAP
jgi:epsilon-lactone hydrolase